MSRHRFIKNLILNDELVDFDGGDDYSYSEEETDGLSEEDQEKMGIATIAVRAELPSNAGHITDQLIQESLWHTYYDIDRTIAYLSHTYINQRGLAKNSIQKHQKEKGSQKFAFEDFFKDSPWLNIPIDRQAVLMPPLYPRGGLLGGSSTVEPPKISKLQALVASRKKIAQEQKTSKGSSAAEPSARIDYGQNIQGQNSSSSENISKRAIPRGFPLRKRILTNSNDINKSHINNPYMKTDKMPIDATWSLDIGEPSEFANTMFSNVPPENRRQLFTMPFKNSSTQTDPFAGPSPDDVVLAAQSKAKSKCRSQFKTSNEKKNEKIVNKMCSLVVEDPNKIGSKNLDVIKIFQNQKSKNSASFVVIGHVDAGKSTLMGRLLLDLGVVDQRIIKKYKDEAEMSGKSSFAMAWILDQDSEERLRGLTIDVGINKFETEKTSFTILDAPGHRDFIPNMIAGASQADFALLVIDATTGSFESGLKGQTKEHALLVRSMAVQKIIIAVNKLDNVQWSLERYEEIQIQLSAFLTKAGFLCRNIHFIPCSGLLGDNVSQASNNPAASWYKGPTLVDLLDSLEPISHALNKPFRLTISDVFHGGTQYPLSISGRIESGTLQIADNLLVQPSNQKSLIKALELDDKPVDWAVAGQDIVIHLSGIDAHHLKIGDVLCSESHPVLNITEFKLKALAFDFMFPTQVDVHKGRIHTTGRIKDIVGIFNKSSDLDVTKKKPKVVKPGTIALLVVALDHAVPLEISARIVLRYNGVTLAAGILE